MAKPTQPINKTQGKQSEGKHLVIVESPTKAKTITKFLPSNYEVLSSYGHVRDLPKSDIGVDTEKDFEPHYVIPTKARKNLTILKKAAKNAKDVILATDEDREGEAISWHLIEALGLKDGDGKPTKRIVFHEITKTAILEALNNPREINENLVNAQQARRILDRLVGYKLSPFLWKKIMRGLSAGRVQSAALRIIVAREKEVEAFKPQEYWSIEALFPYPASLYSKNDNTLDKFDIPFQKDAHAIVKDLDGATYTIASIVRKEHKRNPLPPFTTSTLQQSASRRLGYSARRTMMLAQNLYERGYITYHRTDSLSIASSALRAVEDFIVNKLGKEFWAGKPRLFKTKSKGAQEAHEAIRPSDPTKRPEDIKKMEGPQLKMYELIWSRFVASQMAPAIFDSTTVTITANGSSKDTYAFRAHGSIMKFEGFLRVYKMKIEEHELPELEESQALPLQELVPSQHFTQPPARYSEAQLIKTLEEHGIGRPSTYAGIVSTLEMRHYVERNEDKRFVPTEIGTMVDAILVEHFPKIVDLEFTAKVEQQLDNIAHGEEKWQDVLHEFYDPFEKNLEEKYEEVKKKVTTQETDKTCPECGKPIIIRFGRFGKFYACSGFPDCKHTEAIPQAGDLPDVHCPKCIEGKAVTRRTKKGRTFYGCSRYPDCDFASWDKPHIVDGKIEKCPTCENILVEKKKGIVCSNKECDYKEK